MPRFGRGPGRGPARGRGPGGGMRVMPRAVRRPVMPGGFYGRPVYHPPVRPVMPVPLVVPVPYYPPAAQAVVRPVTVSTTAIDFAQVLGQLNYLMDQARQNTALDNADIVALSSAIDRAQQGDADGLLYALRGMSAQLIDQARQLGMTYLVQLASLR